MTDQELIAKQGRMGEIINEFGGFSNLPHDKGHEYYILEREVKSEFSERNRVQKPVNKVVKDESVNTVPALTGGVILKQDPLILSTINGDENDLGGSAKGQLEEIVNSDNKPLVVGHVETMDDKLARLKAIRDGNS